MGHFMAEIEHNMCNNMCVCEKERGKERDSHVFMEVLLVLLLFNNNERVRNFFLLFYLRSSHHCGWGRIKKKLASSERSIPLENVVAYSSATIMCINNA